MSDAADSDRPAASGSRRRDGEPAEPGSGEPAVVVDGLEKRYGDVTALDGLSLSVGAGELYGFLGPNGAGKSTAINVLTGQLRPDAGDVRVAGVDPVAEPVRARERIGVLPENGRPPSFLTVREYFDFVATARGLDEAVLDDRIAAWADRLAFDSKLDTLCTDLSQGERQKVLVTQAFVHEPAVVFIDEPLTNLDPIIQERAKRFFRQYAADGNAVVLSTHFVATAEEVCSRVGVLNRGRLLAELDPRELEEESLLDRFFAAVDADVGSADGAPGHDGPRLGGDPSSPGAERTTRRRDGGSDTGRGGGRGGNEGTDGSGERNRSGEHAGDDG